MDLTTTDDRTLKGFWSRTEGTWGMVIVALLALGGLFALKAILPTIIAVLTMGTVALGQLWMATMLATGLAAFLWVLFVSPLPKLVGYYFKANVRRLTGVFVSVYPIEIMKDFIGKMIAKKTEFSSRKEDIRKQKRVLEDTIKKNDDDRIEALRMMEAAKKQNKPLEVQLAANDAGRLNEANEKFLKPSLSQINLLYERLGRVESVCDFKIRDMQSQVRLLAQQNEVSKSTKGVLTAAKAILRGGDSDQEMYDSAIEFVVDDYRKTMGAVDDFMDSTESILNGVDLKNGIWQESALEQLAQLEGKEQLLISKAPAQVITPTITPVEQTVALPAQDYGSRYFDQPTK